MKSLKTALIANIGTTGEPVIRALKTAAEESAIRLFLAYGRAIEDQEVAPISVATDISEKAKKIGADCRIYELDKPEDFERAFIFYKDLINEVISYEPDRVIVDITGGTKIMAAAMTHAVLARQFGAEIIFEYVGGPRNANGRVKQMVVLRDSGIVTQENIAVVIGYIQRHEFAQADFLAGNLPRIGKAGFLRKVAKLLWHWDNFHYEEAMELLDRVSKQAEILIDDEQFKKIADTVLRIRKMSNRMKLALGVLQQMKIEVNVAVSPDEMNGWIAILGDTIANARRRSKTDPLDCVLRCYRAIEIATQIVTYRLGVNPWNPNWDELDREKRDIYLSKINSQKPPNNISLDAGIKLIETLTSPLYSEVNKDIRKIMSARNFSYLEHGYDKISQQTSTKLMNKLVSVITALLSKGEISYDPLAIANELRIEA